METENNTPNPSPLDQAYKKYKDDLRTKVTGAANDQDLVRGIMDNTISRDNVGELKKQIITPEDFRSYFYPKELTHGVKLKENYTDCELINKQEKEIYTFKLLADDSMVLGGEGGKVITLTPSLSGVYHQNDVGDHGSHVWAVQSLPNGDMISAGESQEIHLWEPKIGGGYEKKNLGKHKKMVWDFQILFDGRMVSVGDGNKIYLWGDMDSDEYKIIGECGDCSWGKSIQVLNDGRIIFNGGNADDESRIHVLTPTDNGEYEDKIAARFKDAVGFVRALPNGKIFVADEIGGSLFLFTPRPDGYYKKKVVGMLPNKIKTFMVLPDERLVISSGGYIHLWTPKNSGDYEKKEIGNMNGLDFSFMEILSDGRLAGVANNGVYIIK